MSLSYNGTAAWVFGSIGGTKGGYIGTYTRYVLLSSTAGQRCGPRADMEASIDGQANQTFPGTLGDARYQALLYHTGPLSEGLHEVVSATSALTNEAVAAMDADLTFIATDQPRNPFQCTASQHHRSKRRDEAMAGYRLHCH